MTQLRKRRRAASVLLAILILGTIGLWVGSNYLAGISAVNVSYTARVQSEGTIALQVYETASSVGFFRQSAQRLLQGKTGDADRLNALLDWTYDNVRPPYAAPSRIVSDNAYSIIRRGFGYCDQSAHVFATLAHYAGYDVRLLFLLRADGVSPHSVAQVLVGGRWIVVDPFNGFVWHDDTGTLLTVDDLQTTPSLLDRLGYAAQGLEAADFFRGIVFQSFPYADSNLVLAKIKGKIQSAPIAPTSAAPPVLPPTTAAPSANPATSAAPSPAPIDLDALQDQMVRYDDARRAQLDGDFVKAVGLYRQLLQQPLDPEIAEAVHFFLGESLLRANRNKEAIAAFDQALAAQPTSEFHRSILYYRGLAKESLDDIDGAIGDLEASNTPLGRIHAAHLRDDD